MVTEDRALVISRGEKGNCDWGRVHGSRWEPPTDEDKSSDTAHAIPAGDEHIGGTHAVSVAQVEVPGQHTHI